MATELPEISRLPPLTPTFCFNTTALRDFLRLSRASTDDSLSLHLNALFTPSKVPTSANLQPGYADSMRQIPGLICQQLKHELLFPGWHDRDTVLSYCEAIALCPYNNKGNAAAAADDDDTEDSVRAKRRLRIMKMPSDKLLPSKELNSDIYNKERESNRGQQKWTRNYFGDLQLVDERTDPYSARDYSYTREPKTEMLREALANERSVEDIVRMRTRRLLGERCLSDEADERTKNGSLGSEWQRWKEERRGV